jgi:hypothetical protein
MESSLMLRVGMNENVSRRRSKHLPQLRFLKNPQGSSPSAWPDAKMATLQP